MSLSLSLYRLAAACNSLELGRDGTSSKEAYVVWLLSNNQPTEQLIQHTERNQQVPAIARVAHPKSTVGVSPGVPRIYEARRLPRPSAIMAVTKVFRLTPS